MRILPGVLVVGSLVACISCQPARAGVCDPLEVQTATMSQDRASSAVRGWLQAAPASADAPEINGLPGLVDASDFVGDVEVVEIGTPFYNTETGKRIPERVLEGSERRHVLVRLAVCESYMIDPPLQSALRRLVLPIEVASERPMTSDGWIMIPSDFPVGARGVYFGRIVTMDYLTGPHQPYWEYVFDSVATEEDPDAVAVTSSVLGWYRFEGDHVLSGVAGVPLDEAFSPASFRSELLTIIENGG